MGRKKKWQEPGQKYELAGILYRNHDCSGQTGSMVTKKVQNKRWQCATEIIWLLF
jgi:hypothetical protein